METVTYPVSLQLGAQGRIVVEMNLGAVVRLQVHLVVVAVGQAVLESHLVNARTRYR